MNKLRGSFSYIIGAFLLFLFCAFVYGPVFRHLFEESYFSFDAEAMQFVLRQQGGRLYWVARFLMLPLINQWIGAMYLTILLTCLAYFVDRALRIPTRWKGVGFIIPTCLLSWMVSRGYNLFMRSEPSLIILYIYCALIVAFLGFILNKRRSEKNKSDMIPLFGSTLTVFLLVALQGWAWFVNQNVILSCNMQNKLIDGDFRGIIEDGLKARKPDRNVAAFHAIALNVTGELLDKVFELDYDYPTVILDAKGGMDESENYTAESEFYSGLVQPAYHYTLCQQVVEGPRLRFLKLLVACSAIQGEKALCERYLAVIGKMPFQQNFVNLWTSYLSDFELMAQDPVLNRIAEQIVVEDGFEEDFPSPLFIAYRLHMKTATAESLKLSMAASLYMKDLENVVFRARYLNQFGTLPVYVQQALALVYEQQENVLDSFGISDLTRFSIREFKQDVAGYLKSGEELNLPESLRNKWKDSYMYYYYFGNKRKSTKATQVTGVN